LGNNIDIFINTIVSGTTLTIQDKNSHTNYQKWIVGTPVDNTTYWTIPVTLSSQSGTSTFTNNQDILLIIILAGVCTVYPFIASVNLMKHLSPYTINLTVNLEGVYGIILACILFHENKDLSITFYVGFGIILSVIFLNALLKQKFNKA
jgi:drug/metabolite transporter (DMT)-like permease